MLAGGIQFFVIEGSEITNSFVYGGGYAGQVPGSVHLLPVRVLFTFVVPATLTAYLPALLILGLPGPALLPAWQASVDEHPAELRWSIGEAAVEVRREHRTLFCEPVARGAQTIRLSQEIFTRLLFGYRPVAWAARQPGQDIPPALTSLVERLFCSNHLFVPKSDEF